MDRVELVIKQLEASVEKVLSENAHLKAKLLVTESELSETKKELNSSKNQIAQLEKQLGATNIANNIIEQNQTQHLRNRLGEYIKYIDIIIHYILTEHGQENTHHITTNDR